MGEADMGAAVQITRLEHTPAALRDAAGRCGSAKQARRLLAIALVVEGASRQEAARQCGMDRQTLRDWVHRYNEAGIAGLRAHRPDGRPAKLTAAQLRELHDLVVAGPDPKVHKVVRWRCVDLRGEVANRFDVAVPARTIGKWLRKLGLTRLQPRPYHPNKDAEAQAAFKKTSPHS
jgi:transposase